MANIERKRKYDDSGGSQSNSKRARDFTPGRHDSPGNLNNQDSLVTLSHTKEEIPGNNHLDGKSGEAVTPSGLEKDFDEMIGKARTALEKMDPNKLIDDKVIKKIEDIELIKKLSDKCKHSHMNEHEKNADFLRMAKRIAEKIAEISEIERYISDIERRSSGDNDLNMKLKQIELNNKKLFLPCEEWIIKKERDVTLQKESILIEAQMLFAHLAVLEEKSQVPSQHSGETNINDLAASSPEASSSRPRDQQIIGMIQHRTPQEIWQKLGHLSREFQYLEETYQNIKEEYHYICKEKDQILQEQKRITETLHEVGQKIRKIEQNLTNYRINLRYPGAFGERDRNLIDTYDKWQKDLETLQGEKKYRQKNSETLQEFSETLQKRSEVLQEKSKTRQKRLEVLQQLHDTEHELVHNNPSPEKHARLENSRKTLQEHSEVLQQLHDTEHELVYNNPSPEKRAHLENSRKVLQEHSKVLQQLHDTEHELKHGNLSLERRAYLEKTCQSLQVHQEVLQKWRHELRRTDLSPEQSKRLQQTHEMLNEYYKVLQKWYDTQNELRRPDLSPEEYAYLEKFCQNLQEHQEVPQKRLEVLQKLHDAYNNPQNFNIIEDNSIFVDRYYRPHSHYLPWLTLWYKTLVEQAGPDLSLEDRKRLEIKGSICKEAVEVVEKLQRTQEKLISNTLPEGEHANLKKVYDLRREYFKRLCMAKERVEDQRDPCLWLKPYEVLENLQDPLSVLNWRDRQLEKRAEVLEKVQDILTHPNLSQAERPNLRDALRVLKTREKNLGMLWNPNMPEQEVEMVLKLDKALEKSYSSLTDSHLSQAEHAQLKTSRRILKSWYKNLEKYVNNPSESQKKKYQTREKLYNAWESGTISTFSKMKHPKLFWKTLLPGH